MDDLLATQIGSIAATPLPARLDSMEIDVIAAIDRAVMDDAGRRRAGMLSIAAALGLGLAGGGLIAGTVPPAAAGPMGIDALAPSTLLLGR